MKKIYFVLLLILVLLSASACASADLKYTLTEDNKTDVQYSIVFDQTDQDVSAYLNEIGSFWAENGMSIYVDKDQNSVSGEETIESNSFKEAAGAFGAVFAAPDSIFSNVNFAYSPSLKSDDYRFSADVSLADVIRQRQALSIPSDQISKIEEAAAQGSYRISISLPGDIVDTNADSRDGSVCTWKLEYGKATTLTLHTQKQNTETVQSYNKLSSIMADNNMLFIVCVSTAGFCVLMITASIVLHRKKFKRSSEVRVKHFR